MEVDGHINLHGPSNHDVVGISHDIVGISHDVVGISHDIVEIIHDVVGICHDDHESMMYHTIKSPFLVAQYQHHGEFAYE